ncbi:MAG: hypothetical protein LBS72_02225 [Oscillospiraceae bacterium]|nr:hypothetical protein [Oscillospiraceae bacterium]
MQDFYASIWLSNIGASLRWSTDAVITQADEAKPHKYARKTDVNRLHAKLRGRFYLILYAQSDEQRQALIDALLADIARYPVDVKPDRSVPRNMNSSTRLAMRKILLLCRL